MMVCTSHRFVHNKGRNKEITVSVGAGGRRIKSLLFYSFIKYYSAYWHIRFNSVYPLNSMAIMGPTHTTGKYRFAGSIKDLHPQ